MTEDLIGYAELIDDAMRGVVRETLALIAEEGLPGEHHCYISFRTRFPGVVMSPTLKDRYPEEMTIVLQHQYWNLTVEDQYFSIELSFGGKREKLTVPFAAMTAFADPSIKFGLQFQDRESDVDEAQEDIENYLEKHVPKNPDGTGAGAQVITLDAFRKKSND